MSGTRESLLSHEAEALGARLPPLLLDAERLASTVSLGMHGRRRAGTGESFWQFRRYRPEDPSTAIDWRQSAKSEHLFVREREWEAAQSVWLWCDGSAGMRYASGKVAKAERARLLALALASLLVRGGERVALYGGDHPASGSRVVLRRIAHALSEHKDTPSLPPDAAIGRNAHFVWFSDFLSPPAEIDAVLRRLARSAVSGVLVRIVDPAEEDFPFTGRTRFESPRGEESETVGRAETVAVDYRARFRAHAEAVAAVARKAGWPTISHRTDQPPETALVALYAEMSGD